MKKISFIILLLFVLLSCRRDEDPVFSDHYELNIPNGFPPPVIPDDNPLKKSSVELGRRLFFDKALSRDQTISCGSCHLQEYSFGENSAVSTGIEGRTGIRNSPPLVNLAWVSTFMRDGGTPTLELQVLAPIRDHNEMDFDILQIAERLKNNEEYKKLSMRAFDRELDAYVIMRALASFERTLISGNSKYDLYLNGEISLSPQELRGKDLFFSDSLSCGDCHNGFLFSNNQFENNGLYLQYADSGRARITLLGQDAGKFRVPSLRNIEVTAPYMHDGSIASLEEVIDHYATGGKSHPNKNALLRGFSLSAQDKYDLVEFLKTLTDNRFLTENH